MRILDFVNKLDEAFDVKALSDEYLKQAAAVDPNAQYKPRMLISPEAATAELNRRSGVAPATQPGTLKAGDGSTVVSGDGTPVRAGTEPVPTPAPAPAEPTPVATSTPVAPPADVNATPIPAQPDPNADNSGAGPAATTNFDSMSFGTAFKTARNQGLKQFNWKGKPYSTQMAGETPKPATGKEAPPGLQQKLQPGSSQKVAPAATSATSIPADASKAEPYWVNGTRYEWQMKGGGRGTAATGSWQPTAAPGDKLQWNSTRARSMSNYTGPDSQYGKAPAAVAESTGFTDENLERIVSLVHYR